MCSTQNRELRPKHYERINSPLLRPNRGLLLHSLHYRRIQQSRILQALGTIGKLLRGECCHQSETRRCVLGTSAEIDKNSELT